MRWSAFIKSKVGPWLEHARYNLKCGGRLLVSGLHFIVHAIVPAWNIPDKYDLLQTGIWVHIEVMQRDWTRDDKAKEEARRAAEAAQGPELKLVRGTKWK